MSVSSWLVFSCSAYHREQLLTAKKKYCQVELLSFNCCSVLFSFFYPELFPPVSCKRDVCCVLSTCQLGNQGLCSGLLRLTTPRSGAQCPPSWQASRLAGARRGSQSSADSQALISMGIPLGLLSTLILCQRS